MKVEAGGDTARPEPLSVLAVDKVAVLKNNRARYRRLVEQGGVRLTLLSPTRWLENCVMEPYQPDAGEPYHTVLGRVSWPGKELLSVYYNGLVRAMRLSRPDVILMMEEPFSMFALQTVLVQRLLAPGATVIFYNNNISSYRRFPYRLSLLYRAISALVFRMSHIGLSVNERADAVLAESSFRGERKVLFYGVNESAFQPVSGREARLGLGLPEEGALFLYAGRLLEQKGVQDLIDAFARLSAERPGCPLHLLIVGDGEYGEALRAKVRERGLEGCVEFRPPVPVEQVAAYMNAATAFVLPSRGAWNEQFGRVNAEAMLVGTTIIGSTSGEIPRVIGDGGFIFRADDVEDLKRTMARVLDDPAEAGRRRAVGRQAALRRYSVGGFVDGLLELLGKVARKHLRNKEPNG